MFSAHLFAVTYRSCNILHSGTAAACRPLECRIGKPTRHGRRVCHRKRDSQRHPYLLRHPRVRERRAVLVARLVVALAVVARGLLLAPTGGAADEVPARLDRKSTRLNSSHLVISYAVFC